MNQKTNTIELIEAEKIIGGLKDAAHHTVEMEAIQQLGPILNCDEVYENLIHFGSEESVLIVEALMQCLQMPVRKKSLICLVQAIDTSWSKLSQPPTK